MKCCPKLETAKERCPIVFQGHPSNFKVTRYKTSPILTQIRRFRTIGRSQLSNPSDLPCFSVDLFMILVIKMCTRIESHIIKRTNFSLGPMSWLWKNSPNMPKASKWTLWKPFYSISLSNIHWYIIATLLKVRHSLMNSMGAQSSKSWSDIKLS